MMNQPKNRAPFYLYSLSVIFILIWLIGGNLDWSIPTTLVFYYLGIFCFYVAAILWPNWRSFVLGVLITLFNYMIVSVVALLGGSRGLTAAAIIITLATLIILGRLIYRAVARRQSAGAPAQNPPVK